MPNTAVAHPLEDLVGWERALVAFLVEKEGRSGSRRTVEGYSRMLQDFFVWAHAIGLSDKEPSSITIGAHMACVSGDGRPPRPQCRHAEGPRTDSESACTPMPSEVPGQPRVKGAAGH